MNFTHVEDNFIDFNREKLIPYKISDRGPAYAKGDINNDGWADIIFGGSKFYPNTVFYGNKNGFNEDSSTQLKLDSIKETTGAAIFDVNLDGLNDILFSAGGGDFFGKSEALTEGLYLNNSERFTKADFPQFFQNSSTIVPIDFDIDGDLDVFIGGYSTTGKFGQTVNSHLLKMITGNLCYIKL